MIAKGTDMSTGSHVDSYLIRVFQALRRIIRAVDIYSRRLASDFSVTSPQLICLTQIVEDEQTTLSSLSKQIHLSSSTVCGILDRLRIKGLIHSERSDVDRRKVVITASDKGKALVRDAPPLLQVDLAHNLSAMPPGELAAIAGALERIVQMMEIRHLESSPILALESEPAQDRAEKHTND